MHRLSATACVLLLTALSTHALQRTALVPPNTQIHARISNATTFLEKLGESSIGKLWADPQFQDFLGIPEGDFVGEVLFGGEKTAESEVMQEQLKMLKGELVVAKTANSDDTYLIFAMSEEDFLRSLVMDERMAKSADDPIDIVKSSFQGVDVIEHIQHEGTESESHSWQAFLNNTLVMGPDREWIEKSIIELKKEPVDEPEGNPVLDINAKLASYILEALEEANNDQDTTASGVNSRQLFETLGLMGIEILTARIELHDDELIVDSNLQATSLGKGLFTLLDMQPAELPDVDFVPENITLIEVGRVNLLRFWQEIPIVLSTSMPAVKPQLDLLVSTIRDQIGVDLEKDLLAHLGTRYLAFSTLNNEQLVSVIALELKDGQAFRNGLETVMNAPIVEPQLSALLDTVNFIDHTLYVAKSPDPANSFAFAAAGNYLLYGDPDGVRQVIRNLANETRTKAQLEDNELVRGLRRYIPGNAFGYSAIDWKKNMPVVVRAISQSPQLLQLQNSWARSGSPLPPDFSKLPPTDHIASFFNTSYLYIERTNEGLHQRVILKY